MADTIISQATKVCTRCKQSLPVISFVQDKKSIDNLNPWCRSCCKTYKQSYYQQNSSLVKAASKTYRQSPAGKETTRRRRSTPKWREANRVVLTERSNRSRARKKGAPVVERVNRAAIIARDKSTCYLCNKVLSDLEVTLDHVVPLNRGGSHTAENLRVACKPCNRWKSNHLLSELCL